MTLLHLLRAQEVARWRARAAEAAIDAVVSGAEAFTHAHARRHREAAWASAACIAAAVSSSCATAMAAMWDRVELPDAPDTRASVIDFAPYVTTHPNRRAEDEN